MASLPMAKTLLVFLSIAMIDGSSFDPANPIELAAAMSQPAEARGYLALLRTFVNDFETGEHRGAAEEW